MYVGPGHTVIREWRMIARSLDKATQTSNSDMPSFPHTINITLPRSNPATFVSNPTLYNVARGF